jgi:elongation factor 3
MLYTAATTTHQGNLNDYVQTHPHARSFFELKASKLKFSFPQPGPIEGVKSKGRALMKMSHCDFTYPGNTIPTLFDITVQVSLASRVACVGENGAGKSTMIKVRGASPFFSSSMYMYMCVLFIVL